MLAQGTAISHWARRHVSPDNRLFAYGVDTGGRLFYTIRVKDLTTGKMLDDTIADVTGNLAWANDSQTLFYTKQDPKTLRAYRIYRHRLGTPPADDPARLRGSRRDLFIARSPGPSPIAT